MYALEGIIVISVMEFVIAPPLFQFPFEFQLHTRRSPLQISSKRRFPCSLKCHFDETRSAGEQADKKTAIQRICEKLRSAGYMDEVDNKPPELGPGSAGEIFLPNPKQLAKYKVGHTLDRSWSTPQYPNPEVGQGISPSSTTIEKDNPRLPTLAEMTIPPEELRRLRTLGIRTEKKLKIGKAGITEGIVDSIHERWRNSEVVKIKCEDFCGLNMKRTHDILEMKTGGLVVWRAGSVIVLYRGLNYEPPYVKAARSLGIALKPVGGMPYATVRGSLSTPVDKVDTTLSGDTLNKDSVSDMMDGKQLAGFVNSDVALHETDCTSHPKTEYEREIIDLLEGLGPRFTDWWGYEPLPVDADLLPPVILGYKKPFRLLPYGMKPKLTDSEMTYLRRLARPLPPHFALGINKHLQGLAIAMVKLWDKCEIAKIAVKRGVQNTDSEKMAEELKRLTGGSLLSRDKEFIVFYRGKDFLPSSIAAVLAERKAMVEELEEKETKAQLIATSPVLSAGETTPTVSGTVSQIPEAEKQFEEWIDSEEQRKIKAEALRAKRLAVARRLDSKLTGALSKKSEVENELGDIEKVWEPVELSADRETITEEERFMLRKLGLRMKPFLLLGRRGVFDGVVENMHLHWKYRDLVKIISKEKSVAQVKHTARMLEYESGGILVAVETVSKGHAIIIYRGKNYRRPAVLRPKSLLTKKEALKRSIEIQRHESLNLQILRLERNIELLKNHLSKVEDENEEISELLIDELESTCPSEDEDEIILQSTKEARSTHLSKDEEGTDTYSTKELGSVYPPEKEEDEDEAVQFDPYDSNSENEDSFSNFQSGKNAAQLVSNETGTVDSYTIKNKMPDNVYRAEPLSNKQRLVLRKQALKWGKPAQYHVGKNNVVHGLVKSICSYFEKHALVIVGVKGRAKGTSIAEIVFQLEEATGAVLVSQEPTKIILYRGWPEGEVKCSYKKRREESEEMSNELSTAIRKECGLKVQDDTENIQNDSNHKVHAGNEILHNMAEEDCQLEMKFQG